MELEKTTALRLRFRINMLLAERDISVKELFVRVKALGSDISSSHFYRQMKPYYPPIRLDLLALVVQALNVKPSELFDLVEADITGDVPQKTLGSRVTGVVSNDSLESEKVAKARSIAKAKRAEALLGAKITVMPTKSRES